MTLICKICSRPNAAKHFNGVSCRSCKGFFRRVVKLKRKYTCLLGNECEISKTARLYCRACRFRRCLEAEMDPKLVQSDRSVDLRSSPQTSPSDTSTEITTNETILPASCSSFNVDPDYNENSLCSVFIESSKHFHMQNMGSLGSRYILKPFNPTNTASVVQYLMDVDNIMFNFYEAELDAHTHAATDLNYPMEVAFLFEPRRLCTRTKIHWRPMYEPKMENFQFIWARGILHYADGISFYPQLFDLDYHDRLLIAVARCCPVGSMETAMNSMKVHGKKVILLVADFYHVIDGKAKASDLAHDYAMEHGNLLHDEFIEPARKLSVTQEEIALLRIILFFGAAVPGLSDKGREIVANARSFYLSHLSNVVRSNCANVMDSCQRLAALLSLLPSFEKTTEIENRYMTLMNMFNLGGMNESLPDQFYVRKRL